MTDLTRTIIAAVERLAQIAPACVLIIDDDDGSIELTRAHLEGVDVRAVHTPAEALALLETITVDRILLDVHIPGCDVPASVAQLEQHAPVILYTHLERDALPEALRELPYAPKAKPKRAAYVTVRLETGAIEEVRDIGAQLTAAAERVLSRGSG